jgi:Fe2+ transport system protein FeoA
MLEIGSQQYIKKITGKADTRRFLASLGFVKGESGSGPGLL